MNYILKQLFPFLFILLIASCNPEDDPSSDIPTKNYLPATGNNLVLFESDLGNSLSDIKEMIDDGTGNFFFRGEVNNKSVIGKINISGDILWQREMNYTVKSIKKVDAENTAIHHALLVCGNTSEEESGSSGFVSIYDVNGALLSSKVFDEYQTVLFNDISKSGHFTIYNFVAVGGAGNGANDIYPYLTYFTISPNGQISQNFPSNVTIDRKSYRFLDYAHFRFEKLSHGRPEPHGGGGQRDIIDFEFTSKFVLSLNKKIPSSNLTSVSQIIHLFEHLRYHEENTNSTYFFNDITIDWNIEISSILEQSENVIQSIVIGDGIYVIGHRGTEEEKTNGKPTNGGYWYGGFIVKLDFDGNILYSRTLSVSPYDDKLHGIINIDNDYLYLSGEASSYSFGDTDENKIYYGYGWIAKVDKNSGSMMNSVFIGAETEQSSFYSIGKQNNRLFVGGYKYNNEDKKRKAYFWEIDKNKL